MQLVTKICILSSRRFSSSDFLLTAAQAAAGSTRSPAAVSYWGCFLHFARLKHSHKLEDVDK